MKWQKKWLSSKEYSCFMSAQTGTSSFYHWIAKETGCSIEEAEDMSMRSVNWENLEKEMEDAYKRQTFKKTFNTLLNE